MPKTIDSPSILYTIGSAVGPYRLVEDHTPHPAAGEQFRARHQVALESTYGLAVAADLFKEQRSAP